MFGNNFTHPRNFIFLNKVNLIIGNSAAAISAVKAIRRCDTHSRIILVAAENCNAYSPVLLTYYMSNIIGKSKLFITDENFYNYYSVEARFGEKAINVNPVIKEVALESGEKMVYDNLLIATGSSPKAINLPGEDLPGIFSVKKIADAEKIVECNVKAKEVAVLGGGLIGLQVANALHKTGRKVTMVVSSDQLLSQNVDSKCAEMIEREIVFNNISVLYRKQVCGFQEIGRGLRINMNLNEMIEADMIVLGKGTEPNKDLVNNSGIKYSTGIIVDEYMRTNYPDVYAAGDVAEGPNIVYEKNSIVPNWINACNQGFTAGSNMAGKSSSYYALNENITSVFSRKIAILGNVDQNRGADIVDNVYCAEDTGIYRKIRWNSAGEIVGAVLFEKVDDAGIIRNLIKNRTAITKSVREQLPRKKAFPLA